MVIEFLNHFWQTLELSAPLFLLGLGLAGLLHLFLPEEKLQSYLGPKAKRPVLAGAIIGVPLPLCSCSVLPSALSLAEKGASSGAISSFLISTPETGVDSIGLTYALMDLPMTLLRPIAAFCSAIVAGGMQEMWNPTPTYIRKSKAGCASSGRKHDHHDGPVLEKKLDFLPKRILQAMKYGYLNLLQDFALWMLIGLLLSTVIEMLVPAQFFLQMGALQSRAMIILVAVPLYVCASASTPIAAALVMKGLSPGAALLFLLVGPATNLSNLFVTAQYLGWKGNLINLFAIVGVALIFSFLTDWLYLTFHWPLNFHLSLLAENELNIFSTISALVLLVLMLRGIWAENLRPRIFPTTSKCC